MEEGEDSARWVATFRGGRLGEGEKVSGPPGAWDSAWDPPSCPQPPQGCPVLTHGGGVPFSAGPDGTAVEYGEATQFQAGPGGTGQVVGEGTQFKAGNTVAKGNTGAKKEWTPIEEGCKACSRAVGAVQGGGKSESREPGGPVTCGGPTVLDSEGGVITSRLCQTCAKLWRLEGQPNPWVPMNRPGGSRGPNPPRGSRWGWACESLSPCRARAMPGGRW
jgi:hypothetical protein